MWPVLAPFQSLVGLHFKNPLPPLPPSKNRNLPINLRENSVGRNFSLKYQKTYPKNFSNCKKLPVLAGKYLWKYSQKPKNSLKLWELFNPTNVLIVLVICKHDVGKVLILYNFAQAIFVNTVCDQWITSKMRKENSQKDRSGLWSPLKSFKNRIIQLVGIQWLSHKTGDVK